MKYIVIQFKKGIPVKTRYYADRSHRKALTRALAETWFYWDTALVVNEKLMARRYVKTGRGEKLNREVPQYFKTTYISKPAVLIMFGRHSELHKFDEVKERDAAYECMTSTPVESVVKGKARKDTTALLDETLDSKSGSTLTRILSGYAIPVTWMDSLTHFRTAAPSGSDSVDDSDEDGWSLGLTPSHSGLTRTFATVKKVRAAGFTKPMAEKIGKTIDVKKTPNDVWKDEDGWNYLPEWLDFDNVTLKVIQPEFRTSRTTGMYFGRTQKKFVGKVLRMNPCNEHFTKDGLCLAKEWLIPASLRRKKVYRGTFVGGKSLPGLTFLRGMKKWVGKKCHFTSYVGDLYTMVESNYIVHKDWVDFKSSKRQFFYELDKALEKFKVVKEQMASAKYPYKDKKNPYYTGGS